MLPAIYLALSSMVFSQKTLIVDFQSFVKALNSGCGVKLVVEYSKTKNINEETDSRSPDVIGGMEIRAFEYFAKGVINNEMAFVAASETQLIHHPRHGFIYNYAKFKLFENQRAVITVAYLSPDSFEVIMKESYEGNLNSGDDNGAFLLYRTE